MIRTCHSDPQAFAAAWLAAFNAHDLEAVMAHVAGVTALQGGL